MPACLICSSGPVAVLLDLGHQALSNRFLPGARDVSSAIRSNPDEEPHFPFALGQCQACGLIQFLEPIPPRELKPRFDWIRYNEAEGHLDDAVSRLCRLPGFSPASAVGAVTFKDDSTLARFQQRGSTRAWRLDPALDLAIADPCAGLETIQERLTSEAARAVAVQRGSVDVLIVRHVLEHAHDPRRFASALRCLVRPGGHLLFEVPDCTPALARRDYTMPWEEHITYFTPPLFARSLAHLGFRVVDARCYPYGNENSLVSIVQRDADEDSAANSPDPAVTRHALDEGQGYAATFASFGHGVRQRLAAIRRERGAIALFGAGHLGCAWINFLGLASFIDFVVDDHPGKAGLLMPGSRLPILPSSALVDRGIKLCLTSLSAESEARVRARNTGFLDAGGTFASIFPGTSNSLTL